MPRRAPDPREHLLSDEECCARLGIGLSAFYAGAAKHPVLRMGRRCPDAKKVRWKASALALYIEGLPSEPARRAFAPGEILS